MKVRELREMKQEELIETRKELNRELLNLRHQITTHQLENPKRIETVKKTLARIQTILRERELGIGGLTG